VSGNLPLLRGALACSLFLAAHPASLQAQGAGQTGPKAGPHSPAETQDKLPGETLSQQLDRNKGVIRPPSGTDPKMTIPPPPAGSQNTPVIPPPGSPGGDQSVQPK
jgi:hypothetical protein